MEIGIKEMRSQMSELLNQVAYGGERVILKRRKKMVAAIISMEDLARLEAMEDEADLRAVQKARKEKGSVSWKKAKVSLGL